MIHLVLFSEFPIFFEFIFPPKFHFVYLKCPFEVKRTVIENGQFLIGFYFLFFAAIPGPANSNCSEIVVFAPLNFFSFKPYG